jgi:hypothetical protein
MIKRVVSTLVLIFLSIFTPWWVALLFGLMMVFYFENYYEFILIGLIADSMYGSEFFSQGHPYLLALLAAIILILSVSLKKRLIMYS